MKRKPILTRDDAERVAERVRRDTEALFAVCGQGFIWKDEILPLNELKVQAEWMWQRLLRRGSSPQEPGKPPNE